MDMQSEAHMLQPLYDLICPPVDLSFCPQVFSDILVKAGVNKDHHTKCE